MVFELINEFTCDPFGQDGIHALVHSLRASGLRSRNRSFRRRLLRWRVFGTVTDRSDSKTVFLDVLDLRSSGDCKHVRVPR